ncbi:MAG: hypothetical protein FJ303_15035 [Planctomycetes bacterium]|nr:hypothetical protein [Planctomycetota bacterium]
MFLRSIYIVIALSMLIITGCRNTRTAGYQPVTTPAVVGVTPVVANPAPCPAPAPTVIVPRP